MARCAKVVVANDVVDALDHERQVLADIAEVAGVNAPREDDLWGHVEDADALMFYHPMSLTERTIGRMHNCKIIVRCGVGYDNVDIAAARRHGIPVANVPDYGTEEVADSAIGLALALTRGIHLLNSTYRAGADGWTYRSAAPVHRLRGRVFGVVGLGRIGTATALRAKALGMDVAFYDPYKPDGYDKSLGVRRIERLDDLLKQVFILSLHCPLTEATRHIVDARALSL